MSGSGRAAHTHTHRITSHHITVAAHTGRTDRGGTRKLNPLHHGVEAAPDRLREAAASHREAHARRPSKTRRGGRARAHPPPPHTHTHMMVSVNTSDAKRRTVCPSILECSKLTPADPFSHTISWSDLSYQRFRHVPSARWHEATRGAQRTAAGQRRRTREARTLDAPLQRRRAHEAHARLVRERGGRVRVEAHDEDGGVDDAKRVAPRLVRGGDLLAHARPRRAVARRQHAHGAADDVARGSAPRVVQDHAQVVGDVPLAPRAPPSIVTH